MPKKAVKSKKNLKKEPTMRQRKALKIALENGGKISPAMSEAGFSPAYAKNPQKLKDSDGWKSLLVEVGLDDKTLLKKSKQHLDAKTLRQMQVDPDISDSDIRDVIKKAGGVFLKASVIEVVYKNKKGEEQSFMKKNIFYSMPDNLVQDKAL